MSAVRAINGQGLLILFLTFLIAGCASIRTGPEVQVPEGLPSRARLETVPFHGQKKYQCGPAALAMVLQWSGLSTTPDDLVSLVYMPARKGSLQSGLVAAARRRGRLAYPIQGLQCLAREVTAGRPVIVLQNLGLSWLPRWHYSVVVGYDFDRQVFLMHSGNTAFRSVGMGTFLRTWQRSGQWGLCVLPPGDLPVCAVLSDYLKAALGLQQAGDIFGAVEAFSAAAALWPQNVQVFLSLANARYAAGLLSEAVQALSHAVQIEPDNGTALNNLAHVLAESGDLQTAELMARRAVATGGTHLDTYRRTLNEIISEKSPQVSD